MNKSVLNVLGTLFVWFGAKISKKLQLIFKIWTYYYSKKGRDQYGKAKFI